MRSKGFKETPLEEGNFVFPDLEILPPTHPSSNPCPRNCPHPAGAGLIPPTPFLTQEKFPTEGFLRMSSCWGELLLGELLHVTKSSNSNILINGCKRHFQILGADDSLL